MVETSGTCTYPPIALAQLRSQLLAESIADRESTLNQCSELIEKNDMAPFYQFICKELNIECDSTILTKIQAKNQAFLEEINEKLKNCESNEGESEVVKVMTEKADYLMKIGNKSEAIEIYNSIIKKNPTTELKVQSLFKINYLNFFFFDLKALGASLDRLDEILTMHSGWEEKNRFKVYKGLYYLTQSKFSEASHILLETIATFNTTELLSYEDLVCYTVSVAMLALPRRQLKKKCVDGQEIQESLYGTPLVKNFLKSLYSCQYSEFLVNLAQIEQELKKSLFMGCVYYIYIDQIRAVAYSQLLESYSSISLDFMADTFGVTPEFIDEEVSYYISKNMISCQIDKLSRTINTLEPQIKNEQFSKVISSGDSLLDKLQKLLKKVQTV